MTTTTTQSLNDRVDPPILIQHHVPLPLQIFPKNTFHDPADGVAFNPQGLNHLELGKVIEFYTGDDGYVHLHLPLRVVEKDLAILLDRYRTKAKAPHRGRPTPMGVTSTDAYTQAAKTGLRDFACPWSTWSDLKSALEKRKWICESTDLTEESYLSNLESISNSIKNYEDEWYSLREHIRNPENDWGNREFYLSTMDQIETLSKPGRTESLSRELTALVVKANKQVNKARLRAVGYDVSESLSQRLLRLNSTDTEIYFREVAHNRAVAEGKVASDAKSPLSLSGEIDFLKQQFPALKRLSAVGNSLQIDLHYVKVTLYPDRVEVTGDVRKLGSFKTYGSDEPEESTATNRFSEILTDR